MNNVRQALDKLSSAITADPGKAKARATPATARVLDGLRCELTGPNGERLVTDMPPAMGGAASAPNPGWLMRGAMAACTATVISMRAAKLGIEVRDVEVTVETESDLRGLLGMDDTVSAGQRSLRMKVKLGSPGASPAQLRELVEWAHAHSPVGCTIQDSPPCALEVQVL